MSPIRQLTEDEKLRLLRSGLRQEDVAGLRILEVTVTSGSAAPVRVGQGQPLTAEEIAELRKLDAAATPAPWRWNGDECMVEGPPGSLPAGDLPPVMHSGDERRSAVVETDSGYYPPHDDDRELIPAARNALPRLLDELVRARALLKRIEWEGFEIDDEHEWFRCCPSCKSTAPTERHYADAGKHAPDCELAALISK